MKKQRGFTLIELLVVIAIIAILAAILFPVFAQARDKARQITCISNVKQVALGVLMYVQDFDESFPIWDGGIAGSPDWPERVQPYIRNRQMTGCPNASADWRTYRGPAAWNGYGINENFNPDQARFRAGDSRYAPLNLAAIVAPADVGMLGDCRVNRLGAVFNMRWRVAFANTPSNNAANPNACPQGSPNANAPNTIPCWRKRHSTGQNIAYADGHAKHVVSRNIMYRLVLNPWHTEAKADDFPGNPCFFANLADCSWTDPLWDTSAWPWD